MPFGLTDDVNRTTCNATNYSKTEDARKHCGTAHCSRQPT